MHNTHFLLDKIIVLLIICIITRYNFTIEMIDIKEILQKHIDYDIIFQ